jgi:subtilase family serine protease
MFRIRPLNAIFPPLVLLLASVALRSQTIGRVPALIRESVDENKLVALAGNTRPEANVANDLGPVFDGLNLDHMMLQLKRSPQQEQAIEQLIADLHNPRSPMFHKWLTASDIGRNYGLAESDIQTIVRWLESSGFTVNSVYPNRMVIDFSGNAGQVRRAFQTAIHNLDVNGAHHMANFSDPKIPEALAPAVAGVVSLNDFRPQKMSRPKYTYTYQKQTFQALVPDDLATIYDFTPLFTKGITGQGQKVVVIEDTDLYSSEDWTTFRKTFGLTQYSSGSLTTEHPAPPSGANNCPSPGVNSDDFEAILDVEWATAAAPNAAIVVAACADTTSFTSGLFTAIQNLVNASSTPAIMSLSYGICEAYNGVALNASINSLYQQAVAEGISVFVAAGDEGAASCDLNGISATHGITVSGFASTPYNVAVGGTDFSDVLSGTTSKYWSPTNSKTYGSALSYIPEIPWNDSCAGSLLATYSGYSKSYGTDGFCNSAIAQQEGLNVVAAGSGGPSNCASGVPSIPGVTGGSCRGYAKPAWQTGVSGIPNDGVRDIPDVSMFASNGIWGHFAVICFSDTGNGGAPCTGDPSNWTGVGGTSLATPIMAGVQALVNQYVSSRQGNPNTVYYALAVSTPSVFHRITEGDIDENCGGPDNCYGFVGTLDYGRDGRVYGTTYAGALSVSGASFTRAYAAGSSWSFANGIGSVDVDSLVMNWRKGQ